MTFHVEITVMALDKTTLGQGASLFWFRRLAIKMGFVIAYDSKPALQLEQGWQVLVGI